MQKEGTSALFPAARAALQAEDVLAHIQGGLNDVSMDELAENAALADEHAELLTAHGYRLVWPCPYSSDSENQPFHSRRNVTPFLRSYRSHGQPRLTTRSVCPPECCSSCPDLRLPALV